MASIPTSWEEVFLPPSSLSLTLHFPVFCFVFWEFLSGVLSLPSCFASFAELGPLRSPIFCRFSCHTCPHNLYASFLFLFLLPSFSFFAFFRVYLSIDDDVGATTGVFSLFSNGFLLCDHGLDF